MARILWTSIVLLLYLTSEIRTTQYGMPLKPQAFSEHNVYNNQQQQQAWPYSSQEHLVPQAQTQFIPRANPLQVPDNYQPPVAPQSNQQQQQNYSTQQVETGQQNHPSQSGDPNQPAQLATALQHVHIAEQQKMSEMAVALASNNFARDLYKELRSEPGNLVISPLSAGAVLALAWLGAGGRTAQQLATALHLPQDTNQVIEGYRHLFQSLQSSSNGVLLNTGNKVYSRIGLGLRDDFRRAAQHVFGADAEEVNFAQPSAAAAVINEWVLRQTRGKIERFIDPQALSASTSLLLANAVYFKGKWMVQFDPQATVVRPFRTGAIGVPAKNVSLMYTTGDFPTAYFNELKAKVVRLPYVGGRVSMVVVLPDAPDGLPALESMLSDATWPLARLLAALRAEEVHVWLPRFRTRTSLNLNGPLANLGLSELFSGNADFSGIAGGSGFLSRVVQKAFLEVNEEGSEAAAASGGIFLLSAGLYNFFRADHPFLFYIVEDQTGTILFQGRFKEPEEI